MKKSYTGFDTRNRYVEPSLIQLCGIDRNRTVVIWVVLRICRIEYGDT